MSAPTPCPECGSLAVGGEPSCRCVPRGDTSTQPYRRAPAPPPLDRRRWLESVGCPALGFVMACLALAWGAATTSIEIPGALFIVIGLALFGMSVRPQASARARRGWRLMLLGFISVIGLTPLVFIGFILWAIGHGALTPGRPLRVWGLRLLPLVRHEGATAVTAAELSRGELGALSGKERRARAKAWTEDARAELSAIDAFERLADDLARAEAPVPLIAWARRAATEERGHARLCFAIASAYAGHALSGVSLPAALVALGRETRSRSALVRRLVVESIHDGCFEEGLAAEVARARAANASDPALRRVFVQIAAEEASHAELAYAIVLWACATYPEARGALDSALVRYREVRSSLRASDLASRDLPKLVVDGVRRSVSREILLRLGARAAA